jgi:hypothetical protein
MTTTTAVAPPAALSAASRSGRDLRLDVFRGLALWFIFIDHLPDNLLQWLTIRNFGFSDATEIFIFISGYSAALAYGGIMRRRGILLASAGIYRRCWQIYIAHIVLFVLYTAHVAYVSVRFDNPMFAEELGVTSFLNEPHVALLQALVLKFRPINLDVLPLYIVLLAGFPPVLWLLQRRPLPVVLVSALLYIVADRLHWNLPTYPGDGVWFFNPFCWQFLFVIGALLGSNPGLLERSRPVRLPVTIFAVLYLLFGLFIVATWRWTWLGTWIPDWLNRLIYPIDKTNMDVLRLLHFLVIAYLTVRLVPPGASWLASAWVKPLLWCGQQSLQIFCLGIFLALVGHFALSALGERFAVQLMVALGGIILMSVSAAVMTWYKGAQRDPGKLLTAKTS